jgi:hypothetical protein
MLSKKLVTRSLLLALPLGIAAGCTQPAATDNSKVDSAVQQAAEAKQIAQEALARAQAAEEAAQRAQAAAEQAAADAAAASDKADRMFQKSMTK